MDNDPTYRIAISQMALTDKLPPGDPLWKRFNASFDNRSVSTWELAAAVYDGHSFTTWHRDNWRTGANYQLGQHIGLDFDTEDQRSTLSALAADRFICRYGALLYTTPSHKPTAPKARAVFLLDTPIHQPINYTLAVSALLWVFGTADRQCKDPVRFFYGSLHCDVEYLDHVLPLDVVKRLIGQYQTTGQREKRRSERRDYHAPVDQCEVADALKSIRPWDLDYDEWLSVLMALHSEYGDAGLPLAESWADGAPGEVERKWKSFNGGGNVSGAVTIATVFALAKRAGWAKPTIGY